MTKAFMQNDLIRYLYGETNLQETQQIEALLLANTEMQEAYTLFLNVKQSLDKVQVVPSERVIRKILAMARSSEEQDVLS